MKNILRILGITVLTVFSFYYTNKMIDLAKEKDPIMIEILNEKDNFIVEPVNATIQEDYIIPGLMGLNIDINKSYYKMKKLGNYNENLYMFINEEPEISIEKNFNKFIISGNKEKRKIALIFKLNKKDYVEEVLNILNSTNTVGDFFIDGIIFENNIELLKKITESNNFLGNLGYNNMYNKLTIKYTNSLIDKFVKYNYNYCLVEKDDYEVLDLCSSLNMYTIKSIPISKTDSYIDIKDKLSNGGIYTIDMNKYTVNELKPIIKYISYKGYNIVTINELISEEKD